MFKAVRGPKVAHMFVIWYQNKRGVLGNCTTYDEWYKRSDIHTCFSKKALTINKQTDLFCIAQGNFCL